MTDAVTWEGDSTDNKDMGLTIKDHTSWSFNYIQHQDEAYRYSLNNILKSPTSWNILYIYLDGEFIYLFIYLFICLFGINSKTAERISTKLSVVIRITPE